MTRKTVLTIAATVALAIGLIAALVPGFLLHGLKAAVPDPAALVMARTAGVLLIAVGIQTLLVRRHPDSPTSRQPDIPTARQCGRCFGAGPRCNCCFCP